MSSNEPKSTPFARTTRTLPPIDVVVDDDYAPERKSLNVSAADLAALRRIVLGSEPPTPESRPSMPVRAAKATGRGALLTSAVIGAVGLAGEIVRLYHPEVASIIGAIARAVGAALGAQ